ADAAIRSYPLVERFNWVWIWMGDPKRADPALIPNWWWADHPDWACAKPDRLHVACNYQLINDNVLDVTHLVYVHPHRSAIRRSTISRRRPSARAISSG